MVQPPKTFAMPQDKKTEHRKRILLISRWGESLDIALAMKEEGHKVKFYIEDRHCREIGTGFVPKVLEQQSSLVRVSKDGNGDWIVPATRPGTGGHRRRRREAE